jgi:hypothetical protein
MSDEDLVLPDHPYKGKFTADQVREALDRKDKLVELLMDPVGPNGTLINIPIDMLHILAFHLAYAGADTHTDSRRLIESRLRNDPDAMFEMYEWRPVGEFGDTEIVQANNVTAEAAGIAATMKQQLTPELRAALAEILADEYRAATPQISRRQRADAIITEQRELPATMKEGTP